MIWIPIIISVICAFIILKPTQKTNDLLGGVIDLLEFGFKLLLIIPALISWIVYLALT